MNRINDLFKLKASNVLSIYFTAGHPGLNDTALIIRELEKSGIDMIEIGMPFSDPMADGPVIQQSSQKALANGMTITKLFEQLRDIRKDVKIPLVLMGYLNPVMQFGVEKFCKMASETGIDGIIIPDLPLDEYMCEYKSIFEKNGLHNIMLVSPQTTPDRVVKISESSSGFIYLVSSSSVTGSKSGIQNNQISYFERIKNMQLKLPCIIGFGISDRVSFETACNYSNGAIIGSAFVNAIDQTDNLRGSIKRFIESIR